MMFDASVATVLIASTGVALLFHRVGLPPVLGLMLTGAIAGPYGLKWMQDMPTIEGMAELGLIFLLFMLGLELSPAKLKRLKSIALNVGVRYMLAGTVLLGSIFLFVLHAPPFLAFMLGGVLSLSSTALVLKCLEDADELASTVGRVSIGTLIVQDIAVIPLLILVPMAGRLYNEGGASLEMLPFLTSLLQAVLGLLLTVVLSFKLVPAIVDRFAQTRNRELFTLLVFSLGIGMAFLANAVGLGMEAGALVGGLALSGSLYSKQVLSDSRPFRDVFASLFFVSLGALLNLHVLQSQWQLILLVLLGLLFSKVCVGLWAAKNAKLPWQVAITASLVLFQVGELSFMVLHHLESAILPSSPIADWFNVWLNPITHAIVLSMLITPLVLRLIFNQGQQVLTPYFKAWDQHELLAFQTQTTLSSTQTYRVILVGYGPVAQQLAEALRIEQVAYQVIESNPQTVKNLHAEGISATFGDATSCSVLEAVGIQSAEMLVVTVPIRPIATEILFHARELNPDLRLVARAKYRSDVEPLYEAGADAVIYDELESGHRLIHSSLIGLGFTMQEAHSMGLLLRHQFESEFHEASPNVLPEVSSRLALVGDTLLEWFTVPEACPFLFQTLEKSQLRQKTGVNIITIIKANTLDRIEATATSRLEAGDVLIVLGKNTQLERFRNFIEST